MQDRSLQDEFRRVIENARDVIVLFGADGKPLYVNPQGCREFYEDPYDKAADPFLHVHPEDRERVRAEYEEIERSGAPRRFELRAVARDGKPRLMQVEATPVRDGSGHVMAVLSISRNVTEERRDEAALKATLETLFEQAPIGISLTDLEGHFRSINPRMREILGYGNEDLSKRSIWDVSHAADRARTDALRADLVSGRIGHFAMEKRIVRVDGEIRWVDCRAGMVSPPLGGPSFVVELASDITERKRIDEALREREELLEAIFDHAPMGIAITDMDARYIRANPRLRRMLGYTEEEFYRLTGWDLLPEDEVEESRRQRDELFAGKCEDFSWQRRYIRKDGEVVWARSTVALLRDANGNPRYAMALVEDVTERRLGDEALRRSERLLREAQELGHTGSWEQDLVTGRILNTEENNRLFFGDDRSKGARLEDYIEAVHPDDRAYVIRRREQLLAEGGPPEIEFRVVWPGGDIHVLSGLATVVRDESGRAVRVYGTNLDMTERRKADEAIRTSREKLQALTHRLVELQETERRDIARELHDRVGQTLTAMRINMDMIRTRLADHDDALIRARNDDSLELMESAFKAVENVMYDLRPPMLDEFGLIAPLRWYAKKFTERTAIRVEVGGDDGWRCGPDVELALFRIAQEALNNVARHARARDVAIDLREIGTNIVLTIEDDGVGFDFDAQRTGKKGYGLTTMRERAEAVGGSFEAHSEKGKGTRIRVEVPRRTE
jgi:PAS domain S-box-containing protein